MAGTYQKKGYLLEDFRLFHLNDAQGAKLDYHYHEFHKLIFMRSGSGSYAVEGWRYLLKPGDLVMIGSHCVHKPEFEPGMPYERIILYISPDFLQRHAAEGCSLRECFSGERGHVLRLDEAAGREIAGLLERLEEELENDRYGRVILSGSLLLQILVEIGRLLGERTARMPKPLLPKDDRILEVLRYLDRHLTEDVNIDRLAEHFYLSRYHLMHRFREETGTTIHAYLSERRLLLARELIADGFPSTEACFACGYGSYSSFSRAYRKLFGTTPTGQPGLAVADETYE